MLGNNNHDDKDDYDDDNDNDKEKDVQLGATSVFRDLLSSKESQNPTPTKDDTDPSQQRQRQQPCSSLPPPRPNLWVVKDAGSNGAGGIWVVGPDNAHLFFSSSSSSSSSSVPRLLDGHRYVAQQYAWPPVLYDSRKCHVRVYGLVTSDGRAFVHRRAFLHVANHPFVVGTNTHHQQRRRQRPTPPPLDNTVSSTDNKETEAEHAYDPCVHITNCCANSHDAHKFAGEICADLQATEWSHHHHRPDDTASVVVPLAPYAPSMYASLAALSQRVFPLLQGGQANHGFEYLGLDFILSHDATTGQPLAYLLEVNAPPSQDTATGLPHAEDLHDTVIRDLLSLWVVPKIHPHMTEVAGGWKCIYRHYPHPQQNDDHDLKLSVPSKAAILNKMRWAILERKLARRDETQAAMLRPSTRCVGNNQPSLLTTIRSWYPFYADAASSPIFLENAGGTQVPVTVLDAVRAALAHRHRSVVGAQSKTAAKATLSTILGAGPEHYTLALGPNATALLNSLATLYVRRGLLRRGDEIILRTENHLANVQPWLDAAEQTGAVIKWWRTSLDRNTKNDDDDDDDIAGLRELVTPRTRIVAVAHASNVLGRVRNIRRIGRLAKRYSHQSAHVVVDGVASVPHVFADLNSLDDAVDWYAISCHKVFGPHLGAMCGRRGQYWTLPGTTTPSISSEEITKQLELGTVSYEACAGMQGLGDYFARVAQAVLSVQEMSDPIDETGLTADLILQKTQERSAEAARRPLIREDMTIFYQFIQRWEHILTRELLKGLTRTPKVKIMETRNSNVGAPTRLPVICFVHQDLSCQRIVEYCGKHGIVTRCGTFLSCEKFQREFDIDEEGVVRFSLVHYNSIEEVARVIEVLESMPGWK